MTCIVANSLYTYKPELAHIRSWAEDNSPETDVLYGTPNRRSWTHSNLPSRCVSCYCHRHDHVLCCGVPQCGWVFDVFLCCIKSNGYCADSPNDHRLACCTWSWTNVVALCLNYTVGIKTCHFILDCNFRISWWISTFFVPTKKGINILHFGLLT